MGMEMNNPRELRTITEGALELSRNGDFKSASEEYFRAAEYAEKHLRNQEVTLTLNHYALLDQLHDEGGQSLEIIQAIITNLKEMIKRVPDDRMQDKVEPIINYFETLSLCNSKDASTVLERIASIRRKTDESLHFSDSIAHVICESLQIMECINRYRLGSTESEEVESRTQELLACVKRRRVEIEMPPEINKYFLALEKCLENVATRGLNTELCIRGFDRLLINPNHKVLYFISEAIRSPMIELVAHFEELANKETITPEITTMLQGGTIITDSEIQYSFIGVNTVTDSNNIVIRNSRIFGSFMNEISQINECMTNDEVRKLLVSVVVPLREEFELQRSSRSELANQMHAIMTLMEETIGKKRTKKIVTELGLTTTPPFITAGIKYVDEQDVD